MVAIHEAIFRDDIFELQIHHGGRFVFTPNIVYEGGVVDTHVLEYDHVSLPHIQGVVADIGGYNVKWGHGATSEIKVWYGIPGMSLQDGRRLLSNDDSARELADWAVKEGEIKIYIEHVVDVPDMIDVNSSAPLLGYYDIDNDDDVIETGLPSRVQSGEADDVEEVEVHLDNARNVEIGGDEVPLNDMDDRSCVERGATEVSCDDMDDRSNVERGEIEVPCDDEDGKANMERGETEVPCDDEDGRANMERGETEVPCDDDDGRANMEKGETEGHSSSEVPGNEKDESDISQDDNDSGYMGSSYRSSDDEGSIHSDDEDNSHTEDIRFNPRADWKDIKFFVGLKFKDANEFREAIAHWSVQEGVDIRWIQTASYVMNAKCASDGCKWIIRASLDHKHECMQIKAIGAPHSCYRTFKNKQVNTKWLARKYAQRFATNPSWPVMCFIADVKEKYAVDISKSTADRAKRAALYEAEGVLNHEYARIRDYAFEVLRSNPHSSCVVKIRDRIPNSLPVFERIYVGFKALAEGFLAGCRKVIGLDGSYLRGLIKGEVLSTVGRDGNNQMYPIAWVVVEGENQYSWKWFLELLAESLEMGDGTGWTIMTDQQKGLEKAVAELLPMAEHRECARHIYSNWKKRHGGGHVLQRQFWNVVKSCTEVEWQREMKGLKALSQAGHDELIKKDHRKFCKAFFSTSPQCNIVDNNISEAFNSFILRARYKTIRTMLEDIRLAVTERFGLKQKTVQHWRWDISPTVKAKLDKAVLISRKFKCINCGVDLYQVTYGSDAFVVKLKAKSCTCRTWELTGIPCSHACSAIYYMKMSPDQFVGDWYSKDKYMKAYGIPPRPMNGEKYWPDRDDEPIQPPGERRKVGRPQHQRRGYKEDRHKAEGKLPRKGQIVRCTLCKESGHNLAGCPQKGHLVTDEAVTKVAKRNGRPPTKKDVNSSTPNEAPTAPRKRGRPRKNPRVDKTPKERNVVDEGFGVGYTDDGTMQIHHVRKVFDASGQEVVGSNEVSSPGPPSHEAHEAAIPTSFL